MSMTNWLTRLKSSSSCAASHIIAIWRTTSGLMFSRKNSAAFLAFGVVLRCWILGHVGGNQTDSHWLISLSLSLSPSPSRKSLTHWSLITIFVWKWSALMIRQVAPLRNEWSMAERCMIKREAGRRTLLWRCFAKHKFLTFEGCRSSFTSNKLQCQNPSKTVCHCL